MWTEDEQPTSLSAADEPPFLQEPATNVGTRPSRTWRDRLTDFADTAQPPLMLLLAAVLGGVGLLLYVGGADNSEPIDPLRQLVAAPTTAAPAPTVRLLITSSPYPASVGPDTGRRTTTTQPPPPPTRPPTTAVAPTDPPPTEPPPTEPPPTEPPPTEPPPTTEPPTTDCTVRIRTSDLYAEPDDDSDEIGRVRSGTYRAVAFSDNNRGWVQIDSSNGTGWIESRRVRSVEGDCG